MKKIMWVSEVDEKRFWENVDKSDLNGCWLWTGEVDKEGYGLFELDGKMIRSDKISSWLGKQGRYGD